ncbi:MAG: M48 family metalloprotease [Magnetococcales bacterium]|nr:M48 family metalloprotease [Magnetococcales bacterium]
MSDALLNKQVSRRKVLALTGGLGILAASPASAGFEFLASDSAKELLGGAMSLAKTYFNKEESEIQIGTQYFEPYLKQSGGLYPDRTAQEALAKFSEPIIATSKRKKLPWEIRLVQSDQVNAWALPGGKMAVNSKLLHYVDHPSALGSVIAHEVGHAELSHGIKQMRSKTFMKAAGSAGKMVLEHYLGGGGGLTDEIYKALEGPLFGLVTAGYSRTHEFEADQHIISVFTKTGLDPMRSADFFKTLLKIYPSSSKQTTSLFSTHPGTVDRITELEKAGRKVETRTVKPTDPPGWAELKEKFPTINV